MYYYYSLILLVPALILGIYAQAKVSSTVKRYSQIPSARGLTGAQGARELLNSAGLNDVAIERGFDAHFAKAYRERAYLRL